MCALLKVFNYKFLAMLPHFLAVCVHFGSLSIKSWIFLKFQLNEVRNEVAILDRFGSIGTFVTFWTVLCHFCQVC